jgi:hypothetical protein
LPACDAIITRITANMSELSLAAIVSTDSHKGTPACIIATVSRMPIPTRSSERMLSDTGVPVYARYVSSSSLTWIAWTSSTYCAACATNRPPGIS